MNVAINEKMHARQINENTYAVVEDRVALMFIGPYTFSHDCLSMLNLYQQHFEVLQCLRKTTVRSTYESLMHKREELEAKINAAIGAANYTL